MTVVSHVVKLMPPMFPSSSWYWPFSGTRSCHAATRWPIQQVTDLEDFDSQHDGPQAHIPITPYFLEAADKNASGRKCISSSRISCQWIARLSGCGVGK